MSTAILYDRKLFVILNQIDSDLAEKTRAQGCSCGDRLHTSNYPRKPRAPVDLGAEHRKRHSFCCAECRLRAPPPSVRFFGRRVYAFPVVVLVTALAVGPEAFARNTEAIRREYAHVPDEDFAAGRRGFFEGMMRRERLYYTEWGQQNLEAPARANLQRAIGELTP